MVHFPSLFHDAVTSEKVTDFQSYTLLVDECTFILKISKDMKNVLYTKWYYGAL